ncbi:MAG: D-alanine--D-alanine ligase [Lachnospiraceae bacterium]|nr:D-alanine--D-alanine ligase [Lachnospiraceae bacterium]MBQ1415531.1 D-alanine--D-alanine ligase [Lachnospiraceae bacterium]MBQ1514226.1 D-alanine--D-alanine ligase [Lachnospiraceae bacterium]
MEKTRIGVIFGGRSSEHDISCISAPNIIDRIDREQYEVFIFGITKDGRWLTVAGTDDIRGGVWEKKGRPALLSPDTATHGFLAQTENGWEEIRVDVIFPVMHGIWGEDGTLQGLIEMAGIPYVGCGVLASAVTMDKVFTKIIVDLLGVRQARYVLVMKKDLADMDAAIAKCEAKLEYPMFVKPSRAGSSKGVSQAHDAAGLAAALTEAVKHDTKVLVEETIVGREIECAVMSTPEGTIASGVGEILSAGSFYDFDSKYNNADSRTVVDPVLPEGAVEKVRKDAAAIFDAVDGFGLSRVDFFVTAEGEPVFNEINTLPGFTAISMYPMLWEAAGVSADELVGRLIRTAFLREDSYTVYAASADEAEGEA